MAQVSASYFNTNTVAVFPASKRNTPYSRMVAEQGITGSVKHLSPDGKGTFLITNKDAFEVQGSNIPVEFCIQGYYFNIDHNTIANLIANTNTQVYVNITSIDTGFNSPYERFEELNGVDDGVTGNYTGLQYAVLGAGDSLPSGWEDASHNLVDTAIQLIANGHLNTDELSLQALYNKFIKPVIVCAEGETIGGAPGPAEHVLPSQLWVDTDVGGIAKYWNGTLWEGIGAVYKQATT